MKGILAVCLAAVGCFAQAQSATQMPTAVVNTLAPSDAPREGFSRLRLSLTSNETSSSEVVRLAGIALCSTSVCYESAAPSSVTLFSTVNGSSTTVAEVEVPFSDIVNVRFKSVGGQGVLHGSVALPEVLKLERGFSGGDILVVVQKRGNDYMPVATATNYIQPEGTTFYYNPKFATTVKLPHGVSLSIPVGALSTPKVFIAGVHDIGDDHPLVDIYPAIRLARPAKVTLPSIARATRALQSNQTPLTPKPTPDAPVGSDVSRAQAVGSSGQATVEINATGVVRPSPQAPDASKPTSSSTVEQQSSDVAAAASCNPAGWCNCATQLAHPPNQQVITNGLIPSGTVYLDWCTTIAPYVHITVSNLSDSRERFTIRHNPRVIPPNDNFSSLQLPLQRITSWAPSTQVMVNGFTWQGWEGTGAGQYGKANGYVRNFAVALGDNILGGYTCDALPVTCTSYAAGGNKRVMLVTATGGGFSWIDDSVPGIISNTMSYVSSSTSIVKNGVCAKDSLASSWSAVGNTPGGRMIFMSSTSGSTTSAAELCSVFKALGVANAIRLDGGPSAALTLDGVLKNPLTGLYFIKYGTARYIPYALKISYPGT